MRRTGLLFTLVLFLSACSAVDLLPANESRVTISPPTAVYTPTKISNLSSPTFTSTPTLTGLKPRTPGTSPLTPTITATLIVIPVNTIGTNQIIPSRTPIVVGGGFETVNVSGNTILWGSCKPGSVSVTARVSAPDEVYSVVFFIHLQNTKNEDTTPWSKGAAMEKLGNGIFTYELKANTVSRHNNYLKAWIIYQLVATDINGKEVGRSPIFSGGLTIGPCM
jgi:hypothetical protein